jgi:hypothetical protein
MSSLLYLTRIISTNETKTENVAHIIHTKEVDQLLHKVYVYRDTL